MGAISRDLLDRRLAVNAPKFTNAAVFGGFFFATGNGTRLVSLGIQCSSTHCVDPTTRSYKTELCTNGSQGDAQEKLRKRYLYPPG